VSPRRRTTSPQLPTTTVVARIFIEDNDALREIAAHRDTTIGRIVKRILHEGIPRYLAEVRDAAVAR